MCPGASLGCGDVKRHWEEKYATRGGQGVSWFQAEPETSLSLTAELGIAHDAAIIDVGGGASHLAGRLLAHGFSDITVLDLSAQSLEPARSELGGAAAHVQWLEQDLLTWTPSRTYDLWHDRALFHFLVPAAERDRHLDTLREAVQAAGTIDQQQRRGRCSFLPAQTGSPVVSGKTARLIDHRQSE